MPNISDSREHSKSGKTARWITLVLLVACGIPFVFALLSSPAGTKYLGFQYNTDDHLVYAAWMNQAMHGRFFFDNRFTTDPQPGLTVHLYFLVLGWIARLTGIPLASFLGRLVFTGLFLALIRRMIGRLDLNQAAQNFTLVLVALGGGVGYLCWQMFGTAITKATAAPIQSFLMGQLPVDVWQPEAFVFPSMLTNGLFMVSLWLILSTFEATLNARNGWKPVAIGFLAVGILMNIHSYDVLTVALVLVGFLIAQVSRKEISGIWIVRAVAIGAGAVIPALWFVHVLQSDAVFQSRAATETFSPNFRAVFAGYFPLIAFGLVALIKRAKEDPEPKRQKVRLGGAALVILLLLTLLVAAGSHTHGYFMGMPAWLVVFVAAVAAVGLSSDPNPTWNLFLSWAIVGLIAIYFPGLFQRKLTMGLGVPWGVLGSYGLLQLVRGQEPGAKRAILALGGIVTCASSVLWLIRDFSFINENVSNTTRHPVYIDADLAQAIRILNGVPGKKVLLALPGAGTQDRDSQGNLIPDSFSTPSLVDVSPIITGLTGTYSYAGHWSETPDYTKRLGELYRFFLSGPAGGIHETMNADERVQFEKATGANYALLPSDPRGLPLVSPQNLGTIVFAGKNWTLIKLS